MAEINFEEFVGDLNGAIFEALEGGDESLAPELAQFCYSTNSYEDIVDYNRFIVLNEDSDRGWNDEKDDYERTIPQQVLFEMKTLRDNLSKVIKVMEGII